MCLARIRWLDTGAGRLDSTIALFWMSFPFLSFPCWYAKPWAWRSGVIQDNPSRELKYPQIMLSLTLTTHVSGCAEAAQHQKQTKKDFPISNSASSPEVLTWLVLWHSPIWESRIILGPLCHGSVWFGCQEWWGTQRTSSVPSVSYIYLSLLATEHFEGQKAQLGSSHLL